MISRARVRARAEGVRPTAPRAGIPRPQDPIWQKLLHPYGMRPTHIWTGLLISAVLACINFPSLQASPGAPNSKNVDEAAEKLAGTICASTSIWRFVKNRDS
jgi:hypothetical protein